MADAKEEVLAQEVNEIFNMEQMFDNIKHQSRSNFSSPKHDNGSLLVRFSGANRY